MRKVGLLVIALALFLFAGRADAQATWNVRFDLADNTPRFNVVYNGAGQTWYAGKFNATSVSGKPEAWLPDSFVSYCVDITRRNTDPDTYLVQPLGAPPSNVIDAAKWARISYIYTTWGASPTISAQTGGAVQLAIWYALEGKAGSNDVTVANGNSGFYVNSNSPNQSVITLANTYLAGSVGQSAKAMYLQADHSPNAWDNQSMIGPMVPEGDAVMLLMAGMGPIGMILQRRRKAAKPSAA